MPDELELPGNVPVLIVPGLPGAGKTQLAAQIFADIRDAVQEMHDSNRDEVQRLSVFLASTWKVERAAVPLPAEAVATHAEEAGLSAVAKLVRAGAKWGAATIIAAIISGPIQYEEGNFAHWVPPPIAEVQQMSPRQIDDLSRQIMQQVEKQIEQHERQRDHRERPMPPGVDLHTCRSLSILTSRGGRDDRPPSQLSSTRGL